MAARKSNYIHYKMWNEITYTFPNFNRLGIDKYFRPTLYWACDYLSMSGSKLNHVGKKGRRNFGWIYLFNLDERF